MRLNNQLTIGLVGNPNSGKSSIFNLLTGLRQKVGNFPGVTVDKKSAQLTLKGLPPVEIIDFPGAYSCYPTSLDERVVVHALIKGQIDELPNALLYVADVTKLDKHLLLFSQLRDLDLPLILVLNMADLIEKDQLKVDLKQLGKRLGVPTVLVSSRSGEGIENLYAAVRELIEDPLQFRPEEPFYALPPLEKDVISDLRQELPARNDYHALLMVHHAQWLDFIDEKKRHRIQQAKMDRGLHSLRSQVNETMSRYDALEPVVYDTIKRGGEEFNTTTDKLDRILTHRIFGPLIFLAIMLLLFQALFSWAEFPMNGIEWIFGQLGDGVRYALGEGWLSDLLVDGVIAGLGGILVFAPQIAILFFLVSLLEEVGYMARAAFMFDHLMQRFGLNGRSVVALISGHACAIPAIMSARTISNWKERLLTILVTPLTGCSARLPVYTVLIGFAVPATTVLGGWLNVQGLAFAGLYVLGIVGAIFSAFLFKLVLKTPERSFLMLELPPYRPPVWRNVWNNVYQKTKTFALEAGKIIIVISILLWVMSSFGPGDKMQMAEQTATEQSEELNLDETATDDLIAANKLEASYAGHLGKFIEPVITPLGYDWKIGIALLTSFAAREVFIGTMATIYSVGHEEDEFRIRERLAQERDPVTGEMVYNQATAWSLLIFYVFAMMCMGTLAVTKRETNSWKWPAVQFFFLTGLAYFGAMLVYQVLS
ncbi:ferrous iron transport protein B [Lewinellaceae bacterium SD302]|nr:ferrous iron transport protein B [Lewinellaceae bacterium SD302]